MKDGPDPDVARVAGVLESYGRFADAARRDEYVVLAKHLIQYRAAARNHVLRLGVALIGARRRPVQSFRQSLAQLVRMANALVGQRAPRFVVVHLALRDQRVS